MVLGRKSREGEGGNWEGRAGKENKEKVRLKK